MSDSLAALRKKISRAQDLQSVVRTMKATAASNIGQYESALHSLMTYTESIESGLGVYFRNEKNRHHLKLKPPLNVSTHFIVFGTDQGLVGQFNDLIVDYALSAMNKIAGTKNLWVVGERAYNRLSTSGHTINMMYPVPSSVKAITILSNQLLIELEKSGGLTKNATSLYLVFNKRESMSMYSQSCIQLLPLDLVFVNKMSSIPWRSIKLPEILNNTVSTFQTLLTEYLFITIYKICAESLASENISRLLAMQRAEKNIDELIDNIHIKYHRLRKDNIDTELFDVIAGFESLPH
jgi:F-type H+-transporting ATPase subunit gamma